MVTPMMTTHSVVSSADAPRHPGAEAGWTRADLHCHTHASSGAAVPSLRWLGVPECYSPPEAVYDRAKLLGMDLVAITDHDTIAGALELVERGFQDVIIGAETTVFFPEDRCKLHVLVWQLTQELFEEIRCGGLNDDVYRFAAWLRERNLPHSLAHPLYQQSACLSRWHIERCALLFKGFETLNGAHAGTHRAALEAYLGRLTPAEALRLVEAHALEPLWPRIWEKAQTGGSDDHGLLNVGRTWTGVAEPGLDAPRFFRHLMAGRCTPGGAAGHSSGLAHQLTAVGAQWAARRFFADDSRSPRARMIASKLLRFAGVDLPRPSRWRLATDLMVRGMRRQWNGLRGRPTPRPAGPLLDALRSTLRATLAEHPALRARLAPSGRADGCALADHAAMASFFDDFYSTVQQCLLTGATRAWKRGDGGALRDQLCSALILEAAQAPYLFSLFHQNKERAFAEDMQYPSAKLLGAAEHRPMRLALFTDTLGDVNGVSRFIRDITQQAAATGRDLHVFTSTRFTIPPLPTIHNFTPVMAGALPKYPNLEYVIPPVVRMLRAIDEHQPDAIHVSTPGPVGLVGFLAARMLRVPIVGVYHTDFPAYIDELFDDPTCSILCRGAMREFYKPFRAIFTRSADYVASLERLGIARERVLPLRPGMNTEAFHPRFRDERLWTAYGGEPGVVRALYVGRVSLEKNLPLLTRIWKQAAARLAQQSLRAELIVVGDGPYRPDMEAELVGTNVRFLGFRYGEELAQLYASSDFFLFPSVTDTLGQVVMEAQASGLPVLVTNVGGPKEIVREGQTGFVLSPHDLAGWVGRIVELARDTSLRARLSAAAVAWMSEHSISASFDHFWEVHVRAWKESLRERHARPDEPAAESVGGRLIRSLARWGDSATPDAAARVR